MTASVTLLVIDHNRYFAEGLRVGVSQYFGHRKIQVIYSENIEYKNSADMIFMAMDPGGENPHRYKLSYPLRQCLFLIKERHQTLRNYPTFYKMSSGIISREQSLASILALLDIALLKYDKTATSVNRDNDIPRQPVLTYREYEIMRHLFFGLNNHAISHQLNISEKTVSSHKRAAMRKLNLTRNIELNYWLLNGGLNRVKVFNAHQPRFDLHAMH